METVKSIQEKIKELLVQIHSLKADKTKAQKNALPGGCYFLSEDEVLCEKRLFGDSRYPYSYDGLTLWAYSSGNVKIEESTFNVLLDFCEGKEPNLPIRQLRGISCPLICAAVSALV